MAGKLKHRFVSPVADEGVATEVGPNEWNDSLVMSEGLEGQLPVRRTGLTDGYELIYLGAAPVWVKNNTVQNSGTGETDLHLYTLPTAHFNVNQRAIRLRAWGSFTANANTKTVRVRFGAGAAIVVNAVTAAPNGSRWQVEVTVSRTGSNAQRLTFSSMVALLHETNSQQDQTETDSGAIVFKVTGQSGTGSNDIQILASQIEFLG